MLLLSKAEKLPKLQPVSVVKHVWLTIGGTRLPSSAIAQLSTNVGTMSRHGMVPTPASDEGKPMEPIDSKNMSVSSKGGAQKLAGAGHVVKCTIL